MSHLAKLCPTTELCFARTFVVMVLVNQMFIFYFFPLQVGLKYNEAIVIRITGCPNGCARPYMAELGFVGDGPNSYQVTCRLMLMNSIAIGFENSSPQVGDGEIKLNVFVHVLNQLWLGGTPNQMSLAKCFMNKVKIQELEKVMEPLFYYWKKQRQSRESFGDFTNRLVSHQFEFPNI